MNTIIDPSKIPELERLGDESYQTLTKNNTLKVKLHSIGHSRICGIGDAVLFTDSIMGNGGVINLDEKFTITAGIGDHVARTTVEGGVTDEQYRELLSRIYINSGNNLVTGALNGYFDSNTIRIFIISDKCCIHTQYRTSKVIENDSRDDIERMMSIQEDYSDDISHIADFINEVDRAVKEYAKNKPMYDEQRQQIRQEIDALEQSGTLERDKAQMDELLSGLSDRERHTVENMAMYVSSLQFLGKASLVLSVLPLLSTIGGIVAIFFVNKYLLYGLFAEQLAKVRRIAVVAIIINILAMAAEVAIYLFLIKK